MLGICFQAYQTLWRLAGRRPHARARLQGKFAQDDEEVVAAAHDCLTPLADGDDDRVHAGFLVGPVGRNGAGDLARGAAAPTCCSWPAAASSRIPAAPRRASRASVRHGRRRWRARSSRWPPRGAGLAAAFAFFGVPPRDGRRPASHRAWAGTATISLAPRNAVDPGRHGLRALLFLGSPTPEKARRGRQAGRGRRRRRLARHGAGRHGGRTRPGRAFLRRPWRFGAALQVLLHLRQRPGRGQHRRGRRHLRAVAPNAVVPIVGGQPNLAGATASSPPSSRRRAPGARSCGSTAIPP